MNTLAITSPTAKAITIPGALFTRNALNIEAGATAKQLKLIGDFLCDVGNSADWWRADYVHAVSVRNAPDDPYNGDDPNAKARTICEEQGMEQGAFYFYVSVGAIFPPDVRVDELSFDHHREALLGSDGDGKEAKEWLTKALANNWSVSELRRAMRLANADYQKDGKKPSGNGYSALLDANRWAKTQTKELPTYTPERAAAILGDVQPLRDFITKLDAIAGKLGQQ